MSFTNEVTMPPNAAPMTTPTARSTTLPRIANSLNSLPNAITKHIIWRNIPNSKTIKKNIFLFSTQARLIRCNLIKRGLSRVFTEKI
ncbi:hypothetical protein GALL_487640 [mine drainage metagenome]|uniref:Uncharacterized protein n=1 Tax=mine drainage metagenome TaxID=410659 RepID=A0A1J5PDC3_9ZZZZ